MQPLRKQFCSYFMDPWNRIDQAMYLTMLLAVILRLTLPEEHFVGARYVYAINLVMFYVTVKSAVLHPPTSRSEGRRHLAYGMYADLSVHRYFTDTSIEYRPIGRHGKTAVDLRYNVCTDCKRLIASGCLAQARAVRSRFTKPGLLGF